MALRSPNCGSVQPSHQEMHLETQIPTRFIEGDENLLQVDCGDGCSAVNIKILHISHN